MQILDLLSELNFIRNGSDLWFYDASKQSAKHSVISADDEAKAKKEALSLFNANSAKPAASNFNFVLPAGVTVEEVAAPTKADLAKYADKAPTSADKAQVQAEAEKLMAQGWAAVVEVPADKVPSELAALRANKFYVEPTKPVAGGRVFSTSLVNVFIADDGRVFVGSVCLANISAGEVSILGYSVPSEIGKALPKVGALVEGPAFYPYLSCRDSLMRFDAADRYADPATRAARVDAALAKVGLTQASGKRVHAFSLGMKQRLGIANALLQPRELLILDEPTNGLYPQSTREVRNLIRSLSLEGIAIFISSHLLVEIEQICTHLAVMSQGKIVAQGSIEELSVGEILNLTLQTEDTGRALEALTTVGIKGVVEGNSISALLTTGQIEPQQIVQVLIEPGVSVKGFTLMTPTLEERFVLLTGEGFDVAR